MVRPGPIHRRIVLAGTMRDLISLNGRSIILDTG